MKPIFRKLGYSFCFVLFFQSVRAQNELTVDAAKPVAEVPSALWGIFFEDINFGADGGLYAELVKNRSFEFLVPMMGWKEVKQGGAGGKILVENAGSAKPQNPRYARIIVNAPNGAYGLANEGFRGMGIRQNEQYNFSVQAKKEEGNLKMTVELVNASGKKLGGATIENFDSEWKKHTVSFTASDTASKARLVILWEGTGTIDVDQVSLFPQHTWKERPGGLRADLVQLLADLKPGFIRFPGGCIVEGRDLANRYQWKNTVGPPENRMLLMNRWNVEFAHRPAPDYFQTFGLGFYEYFQLAEDIGAEPLPIINCGMACQYNTGEVASLSGLDPFIQDALDLIEFANGPVTGKWGKLRADMGHPAPFNLKRLGVGNEQWDVQYIERYKAFAKVLKEKYPNIKLVSAAGPDPDGPRFDYAWKELKALNADIIDEHYYRPPAWFFGNATRYDQYDRNGPKVFAGEFAAHSKDEPKAESKNTWISALAEAAFMTGLERNAAVIEMASYAPLFAHVEAWQWRPDLIWMDNLRTVCTPNYYVQKLYATNKGTDVVSALSGGKVLAGKDSLYASAVIDKKTREVIVKFVNASSAPVSYTLNIKGYKAAGSSTVHVLSSTNPYAYNSLDRQNIIYPVEKKTGATGNKIKLTLEPMSFNVIRVPVKL